MKNITTIIIGLCCLSLANAQTDVTEFTFDIIFPALATTTRILDGDDDPIVNSTPGSIDFTISYAPSPGGTLITAGSASFELTTDGSGFLSVPSGSYTSGALGIVGAFEIEIAVNNDNTEWFWETPVDFFQIDNVTLLNGAQTLVQWDYSSDDFASTIDPIIMPRGIFTDLPELGGGPVSDGTKELEVFSGGGGTGNIIFDVAAVPEPSSSILAGLLLALGVLRRRRIS